MIGTNITPVTHRNRKCFTQKSVKHFALIVYYLTSTPSTIMVVYYLTSTPIKYRARQDPGSLCPTRSIFASGGGRK